MSVLKAISLLIRWPNLLFIALTQSLSWFFLAKPALTLSSPFPFEQLCLLFCTVFIAAAGYMINDYFDWQIDTVNKPERVVIGKSIQRRTIILLHFFLNVLAILLAYWALPSSAYGGRMVYPILSIVLLWFYSTTFKRKLLIGNVVVGGMTALTVALPAIFSWTSLSEIHDGTQHKLFAYVTFAFLITVIREIIKDIEDIKGDASQACKTIPLVWGINVARYIVVVLGFVLMGLLAWQCWQKSTACWVLVILIIPIPLLLYKLHQAKTSRDYHQLSTWVKVYTLLGILSIMV